MTVKVKICGLTNAEDAAVAVEAGADAVGFVFHKKSPRCAEQAVVKAIVKELPPFVLPIGVFVNEDAKVVRDIMDSCGLALAQLHGDETAAYCETLGRPVLKAIRLFFILGARFMTSAMAWALSSAGIMPSSRASRSNAANASSSVTDVYWARFVSL